MKQFLRIFLVYYLPAFLWMGGIFYLSSQPGWPRGELEIHEWLLRKSAHVLEFFILTLFIFRIIWYHFFNFPIRAHMLAGVVTLLWSVSDEVHQLFVINRGGKPSDVAIDLVGIILALSLIYYFYKRDGRRRGKKHIA